MVSDWLSARTGDRGVVTKPALMIGGGVDRRGFRVFPSSLNEGVNEPRFSSVKKKRQT